MSASDVRSVSAVVLLSPADHANTAAATGSWTDVRTYEGDACVIQQTGVVTAGTVAGKIQHADDSGGTNAEDLTGATFTSVGTSTDLDAQKITIRPSSTRGFIRYVGTIGTGPAIVGATLLARTDTV